jgi:U4/U6.U5 tri-snRNP-associated protein 2
VLNPTFDKELIKNLDLSSKLSRAIDGTMYLPGIVGLNNIKENDYCNVVLQVNLIIFLLCAGLLIETI